MTQDSRLTKLESAVAGLADGLKQFVDESREYRSQQREESKAMWEHVEKGRARITWPLIVGIGGFMLAAVSAAASVSHAFMESRARQLEIREEYAEKEREQLRHQLERLEDTTHAPAK